MAGGVEKVGFRPIDLKNFISTVRQLKLEDREGSCLLEYFRLESLNKPNYTYVQFDFRRSEPLVLFDTIGL
ncbi:hypothetical protein Leryth_011154 [Lithospermum erythrorhizon]|nr:hypothetical protein Leryth_011154 [Lithospermum erythrorhizon]